MSTIDDMKQNIQAQNKYLTRTHLDTLSIRELLANTHPAYRLDYARKLRDENLTY